jgi:thiol:disulfide interchange protein
MEPAFTPSVLPVVLVTQILLLLKSHTQVSGVHTHSVSLTYVLFAPLLATSQQTN